MPISAIRGQIAAGIDVIVHLGRLRDQSRKVLEVVEVLEYNNNVISTNLLYKFKEDKLSDSLINNSVNGVLEWTGNGLNNTQKMLSAGYHEEAIEYGKRS